MVNQIFNSLEQQRLKKKIYMSVREIYKQAERKGKCRVCGDSVDEKEMNRGRCSSCDYKNLEPEE